MSSRVGDDRDPGKAEGNLLRPPEKGNRWRGGRRPGHAAPRAQGPHRGSTADLGELTQPS